MRTKLVILLSVVLQVVFASCSSVRFMDLNKLKTDLHLTAFPSQKDYPDADAVVLWEEHDVQAIIDEDYNLVTDKEVTKITKLFKNVDRYASVEIPIYSGDELNSIWARTIKPDGTVLTLKKNDFHVTTGVGEGYVFYSNDKKAKFTFPGAEKNSILELHYEIHETRPFIEGIWAIQDFIPVLHNTFNLTVPIFLVAPKGAGGVGWTWRYKAYNCSLGDPTVQRNLTASQLKRDQTATFSWSVNNIPAFRPDPMMGSYSDHMEYVKFSPSEWKTWNDISKWYCTNFLRPQMVSSDQVFNKARELTKACSTQKEKLEKLFAFVQSLRYVAIELGQGGFMPAKPQEVLDRMYGDCKDKSILLLSLLKSVGIKAQPALVLTSDYGKVDRTFPTWTFNHMIVKAETKNDTSYWIDPTADNCSLGEIPYLDQGTTALVLNDDNTSTLQVIPSDKFNRNIQDINIKVDLRDVPKAVLAVRMTFRGQENLSMRNFFADKTRDDIVKFCKSLLADQSLDAKFIDYSFRNMNSPDSDLVFNFEIDMPGALETQGDLIFLNVDPFGVVGDWTWLARDKRTYNIHLDYPGLYFKNIEIILPKGRYSVRNLPSDVMLETDGLNYSKQYGADGDTRIQVKEAFSVTSADINAKHFQDIKNFINSVKSADAQKIILTTRKR